ncbi:attachment protein [Achimota pararubulavirus 3]|uniref:Attachment protein n=1 Tax=Achimota pararubulavirus 3 TaxID=2791004 RepID=A0A875J7D7_9MONO|nr:attachment protein [Achimota pararubulavirus 3]
MDGNMSLSTISLDELPPPPPYTSLRHKRTYRNLYRLASLSMLLTILILSSACLYYQTNTDSDHLLDSIRSTFLRSFSSITSLINRLAGEVNQLTFTTSITLPTKIDHFGNNIVTQVTQLVKQCNAVCKGPGQHPTSMQFKKSRNPTWLLDTKFTKKLTLMREIDTVIPISLNPGTSKDCTRFPSFSTFSNFWCYTYANIESPCNDTMKTTQIVRYGIIKDNLTDGNPYYVLGTHVMHRSHARHSCSITASLYGCYLLCSMSNMSEFNEYRTSNSPPLSLDLISQDGITTDLFLNLQSVYEQWTVIYPGTGGGVVHRGYIMFPVYGGIYRKSAFAETIHVQEKRHWPEDLHCQTPYPDKFDLGSKDSVLYSPYYGDNYVISGILTCSMADNLIYGCEVQILPQGNLTIGAQGKLYVLDDELYYYQRSSSWWPYTQLYKLNYRINNKVLKFREAILLPITSTSRPGYGNCTAYTLCPKICVTGTYQSPWLITRTKRRGENDDNILFFLGWNRDNATRKDPFVSLCSEKSCFINLKLAHSQTHAGYSESHCVQSEVQNVLICTVFFELSAEPWAEMRIQSLSYIVDFRLA